MQINEVISSDSIFGPHDLIDPVRAKDQVDLKRGVSKISEIVPGIEAATIIVAMFRI